MNAYLCVLWCEQTYPCSGASNQNWFFNATDSSIRSRAPNNAADSCLSLSSVVPTGVTEVWSGPLSGGDVAVVLFNRGAAEAEIMAQFQTVGISQMMAKVGRGSALPGSALLCSAGFD
jgi:hypothetical protein